MIFDNIILTAMSKPNKLQKINSYVEKEDIISFCTYQLIKASAGPGEVATILKSKIVNVPFIQL